MSTKKILNNLNINEFDEVDGLYEEADQVDRLELANNNLKSIPETISYFVNLRYLDLSNNQLESIRSVFQCVSLESLNVSKNRLKSVNESFFNLKSLKHLDLSYNQISVNTYLINSLKYNKNLTSMSLEGNPHYDFNTIKFMCLEN
jgi:Leucine-rich repeat (LRR) protein